MREVTMVQVVVWSIVLRIRLLSRILWKHNLKIEEICCANDRFLSKMIPRLRAESTDESTTLLGRHSKFPHSSSLLLSHLLICRYFVFLISFCEEIVIVCLIWYVWCMIWYVWYVCMIVTLHGWLLNLAVISSSLSFIGLYNTRPFLLYRSA